MLLFVDAEAATREIRTARASPALTPRVWSPTTPCRSAPKDGAGTVPANRPIRGRHPKVTPGIHKPRVEDA